MTDQELRALVREAIAAQMRRVPSGHRVEMVPATFLGSHLSHAQFDVGPGPDGSCIIEPSVQCNHCGYCKSYGH
jgi:hypothetical protein